MRVLLLERLGQPFLSFEKLSFTSICHNGLKILSDSEKHHGEIVEDFMLYSTSPENLLQMFIEWHPHLIWSQVLDIYPGLGPLLVEGFRAPGSKAAMERNHKVGTRVHSSRRAGITPGKIEKQVPVAQNERRLEVQVPNKLHYFEIFIRSGHRVDRMGHNANNCNGCEEGVTYDSAMLSSEELVAEEMIALEAAIASAGGPVDIKENRLFTSDE